MPSGVRWGMLPSALLLLGAQAVHAQQPAGDAPESPVAAAQEGLFVREPETPEDLFEAVVLSVKLGQPELARRYLEQLLAAEPDPETFYKMRREHSPEEFLRLTKVRELEPLADTLIERMHEASRSYARDAQRLAVLVGLLDASASQRAWAVQELRSAGPAAVAPLVQVLMKAQRPETLYSAQYALRSLGGDATPALIGSLETEDAALKTQIIRLLADRGDREAVPFLWMAAASPRSSSAVRQSARAAIVRLTNERLENRSAVTELLAAAQRYDAGEVLFATTPDGSVELWRWDSDLAAPAAEHLEPEQARRMLANRFAGEALALAPEDRRAQLLFLTTALARDLAVASAVQAMPRGPGTAFDLALSAGPDLVAGVARKALAERRDGLLLAAVQVLGQVGGEALLYPEGQEPPLLFEALRYPERRVQFAAAEAILGTRPAGPPFGGGEVIGVLARALRSRGEEMALVADSQLERGQRLAGLASQLGYATDVAVSGRDAFRKAAASSDFDLIFVDLNILRWELSETLANLKGDARTAGIPVYLVGPLEWSSVADRYAGQYERVRYVVRPVVSGDLALQLERDDSSGLPPPSEQERLAYAQRALQWLYGIASGQIQVGDARQAQDAVLDALEEPALVGGAMAVLALLATPEAQQALAAVTLDDRRPVEVRRSAADGLCYRIRKSGVQIGSAQVQQLEELLATTTNAELHAALSAVIGCMRRDAASGRLLQQYRPASAPAAAGAGAPADPTDEAAPGQAEASEQP